MIQDRGRPNRAKATLLEMQISKLSLELSTVKHEEAERLYKAQQKTGFVDLGRDVDQNGISDLAMDPSIRLGRFANTRADSWDPSRIQASKGSRQPTIDLSQTNKQPQVQRRPKRGTASSHPPERPLSAEETRINGVSANTNDAVSDAPTTSGTALRQSKGKQRMFPVRTLSGKDPDEDGAHRREDKTAYNVEIGAPPDSLSIRSSSPSRAQIGDAAAFSMQVEEEDSSIVSDLMQPQVNGSLSSGETNRKRSGKKKAKMITHHSSNLNSAAPADTDAAVPIISNDPKQEDHESSKRPARSLPKSKATAPEGDHSKAGNTNSGPNSTHAGLGLNGANAHDSPTAAVSIPRQVREDHYKRDSLTALHPSIADQGQTPFSSALASHHPVTPTKKAPWRRRLLKSKKEQNSAGDDDVAGNLTAGASRFVSQAHYIFLESLLHRYHVFRILAVDFRPFAVTSMVTSRWNIQFSSR